MTISDSVVTPRSHLSMRKVLRDFGTHYYVIKIKREVSETTNIVHHFDPTIERLINIIEQFPIQLRLALVILIIT